MPVSPPICDFGWKAPEFSLPSVDGTTVSLRDVQGTNGTLIMFICNHCPYVVSVVDRLVKDVAEIQELGVGVAAICSNDATTHPADSFPKMIEFANAAGFAFPYLHDETQDTARAYDAACTPDFFGFDADLGLQYRGRLDSAGRGSRDASTSRELYDAMQLIARTGKGPEDQVPSMGCSIKWRMDADWG